MGLIKSFLLVLVCVVLFVSLICLGTFATLNKSLEYEVVKPELTSIVEGIVIEQANLSAIYDNEELLNLTCENNSDAEYVFKDEGSGYVFVIPCSIISQGSDAVVEFGIDYLVSKRYYKEYSCEFWKCFEETKFPSFLVSLKAKDYWQEKYFTFLGICVFLFALGFFLVSKKNNFPILAGVLLFVSSLVVSKLDSIGVSIANIILKPIGSASGGIAKDSISQMISFFFTQADSVFLTMFVLGLILIALGILLKLLKVGFKISNLFGGKKEESKEEIKQIVKQEITKEKVKEKKPVKEKDKKVKKESNKNKKGEVSLE